MAAGKGTFADPAAPYPAPDPSSAYAKARQEWNNREGTLVKRLANWQRCCGGLTLAVVVLSGGLVLTSHNTKVLVHVVEVAENGQVRNAGLAAPWHGQIQGPVIAAIDEWLQAVRAIPDSSVVFAERWEKGKSFMGNKAVAICLPWMKQQWDRHVKGTTVQIQRTSLLPITPDFKAIAVEWIERAYSQQGSPLPPETWKAVVNIAIYPVVELKTKGEERNPLGIFVTAYDWNKKPTGKEMTP